MRSVRNVSVPFPAPTLSSTSLSTSTLRARRQLSFTKTIASLQITEVSNLSALLGQLQFCNQFFPLSDHVHPLKRLGNVLFYYLVNRWAFTIPHIPSVMQYTNLITNSSKSPKSWNGWLEYFGWPGFRVHPGDLLSLLMVYGFCSLPPGKSRRTYSE
jgi:hypothetical protein